MRAVTPIIAVVILVLVTLAAGGLAFLALQNYQQQAGESGSETVRQLSSLENTRIKVERISNGKVFIRNSGTEVLREITVMVDGAPVTAVGPVSCDPRAVCVFEVAQLVSCEGSCDISISTASGASAPTITEAETLVPRTPPQYSGWSVNTTSAGFGDGVSATITWDSGISACTLLGGCYGFSNQTFALEEVSSGEWGTS